MRGSKSHTNRPIYRGKKDNINFPKRKKSAPKKPEENKYDCDNKIVESNVETRPLEHALEEQKIVEIAEIVDATSQEDEAIIKEIKKLRKRIKNIQESVQLSVNIAQPSIWEKNCLNAVYNCVMQWQSIVAYHGKRRSNDGVEGGPATSALDEDMDKDQHQQHDEIKQDGQTLNEINSDVSSFYPMHPESEWSQKTALQVFGLIQMAMQCGPMKAKSPGYFKRCGSDVAIMARSFLKRICKNEENASGGNESDGIVDSVGDIVDSVNVVSELRFTLRQKEAIEKWMRDADKAIAANKPPSKASLKLQKSVNTKGMSRKDKRRKGKLVK